MIITNNSDLHHAWLSTHHGCTVDFGPVLSQDLLVCCLNLFAASHDDSSFCRLSFKVHIYSKITFEVFIIDTVTTTRCSGNTSETLQRAQKKNRRIQSL